MKGVSVFWVPKLAGVALCLLAFLSAATVRAQPQLHLTIDEAYRLARENYPMVKQRGLIAKTKEYTVSNAARGYLPAFSINGQATYQSAVTSFPFTLPIPNFHLPTYSQDQYKLYGEVDQAIYDGGVIKNQKQTAQANEAIQQQNLEVELYALYDRVNQVYLGIILVDEQIKLNDILKKDIQNGIDKAHALVANGTAYKSSVDELSAQLLMAEQTLQGLRATRKAYADILGVLINRPVDDATRLETPAMPAITEAVSRPELQFYDYQKTACDLQYNLFKTQMKPKFNFFVQGGYGRPGLNMLSNDFSWYYIGGLRLSWNLNSLYTLNNQKQLSELNKLSLDIQKETFLLNTRVTQKQQSAEMVRYRDLLRTDDDIIALRESVKKASSAQLENGVLSAHDYLTQVDAEDQARQNKVLHQVQLLQAQYNYRTTTGNFETK
jgi:outer membrane protein TolC